MIEMKKSLAILLIAAFFLAGCSGTAPPVTAEPPAVIPTVAPTETAVPSPTPAAKPTAAPTATPTEVPTPTATLEPGSVWAIAQTMLAECAGAGEVGRSDTRDLQWAYMSQLGSHAPGYGASIAGYVLAHNGTYHSPFGFLDTPNGTPMIFDPGECEGYYLVFDRFLEENTDGDGILAGDAILFYEVGGAQPYVVDGELRGVYFAFPPAP